MAEKQDPQKILRIISSYLADSRDSHKRQERIGRSIANNSAFGGRWDFTNKVAGQSTEALPKVTTAVESFSAFIKQGLSRFGEWFRVEMPDDDVLTPENVAAIIKEYVRVMPAGTIEQVLSDGAKAGALDSLVVFKVHGSRKKLKRPVGLPEKQAPWQLSIDLTPFEDYYPDPTGRGLYEIHEKSVDLFEIEKMAKAGVYDKEQVNLLKGKALVVASADSASDKDQLDRDDSTLKINRATVVIREFFGTLVDEIGELVGEDVQATVANETYLVQEPKPIKAWCGSPFAAGPLTRVPHTVWHRAVMDHVTSLNQALNELFNLIFDAGMSAVHGVKTIRLDWLEDPGSIAGGIAPQQTIALNSTAPAGASAIDVAKTGQIPGEVYALYEAVTREILEGAMTNELKVGGTPQKEVLATEIISSNQNTAVLLDSVLGEYEQVISKALTKAWQLIVQNADNLDAGTIIRAVGEEKAVAFSKMKPDDRYLRYVENSRVVVTGLSSISQQSKELNKLIATIATVRLDPLLMQEYGKTVSGKKLFERLFALAGVDLRDIQRSKEEMAAIEQQGPQPGAAPPNGGPPGGPVGENQGLPKEVASLLQ